MGTLLRWASEIFWHTVSFLMLAYFSILHLVGFAMPVEYYRPKILKPPLRMITPAFTADKIDILDHLRHREFAVLDGTLTGYEQQAEQSPLYELNTQVAFRAFAVPAEFQCNHEHDGTEFY